MNGKSFKANSKNNRIISFLFELQFDQQNEFFNSCTLVGTEIVEVSDNIRAVFDDFSINNWAIGFFYLPTHWTANSLALYEYCDFSQVLNVATPFTAKDWADWKTYDFAGMSNTIVRTAYAQFVTAVPLRDEMKFAKKQKDQMAQGALSAELFMVFFAFDIPPISEIAESAQAIAS